jgi:pimeloyl-ACP methyl ester carboxylesterase
LHPRDVVPTIRVAARSAPTSALGVRRREQRAWEAQADGEKVCEKSPRRRSAPTFVLIPGAGGDPWLWHRLQPELGERGYEAIAAKLPAGDDRAGLPEYVRAVVNAIKATEHGPLILVAQSLGGFTAPLVCQKVPVAMIVLLNAMIPLPNETAGQWWKNTGHEEAKRKNDAAEGRDPDAEFDALTNFFHDVPRKVVDEAMAIGEPTQSGTPMGSPCTFDVWPDVPTRVLIGRDDRFFPVAFQRRIARERLEIAPDEMPGGHLVALSQPRKLADRLVRYAEELQPVRPERRQKRRASAR